MFVLELAADDLYAALGRFLDHARVAGLRLAAVSAHESAGRYAICATIATRDAERVERLARKLRTVAGVADVVIRQNQATQDSSRQDSSRQDPSRQDPSPEQNQSRETETLLVS
jgi:hypothetical protein